MPACLKEVIAFFVPFLLNVEDKEESTVLPEFVDAEVDQCLITRRFNVQSVPTVSKGSQEVCGLRERQAHVSSPEC